MLPRAMLTAGLFHVVQLAVKAAGDVRRRVVRARYGRRGRSGYGIKHLLVPNLEHLAPAQFAKIIDVLDRGAPVRGRRSPPPGSRRKSSATR
jgi:hypothetical protein